MLNDGATDITAAAIPLTTTARKVVKRGWTKIKMDRNHRFTQRQKFWAVKIVRRGLSCASFKDGERSSGLPMSAGERAIFGEGFQREGKFEGESFCRMRTGIKKQFNHQKKEITACLAL